MDMLHPESSLATLLEAEKDVKALAHSQAFELAMLDKLVVRETHFHSDDAFTIPQEITPPGLRDVFSSERNYVSNVTVRLITTQDLNDQSQPATELQACFTANNIPYSLLSNLDAAHLLYEGSDGQTASIEKELDDAIGLVASLTLCVQTGAAQITLAPARIHDKPQLAVHSQIEQLLLTIVKETGRIDIVTKALFDESDEKAILSTFTEAETGATDEIVGTLHLNEITDSSTLAQESELKQIDTILPVEEHSSYAIIQPSHIPPREFAFHKLNNLPDMTIPDFAPAELSPHDTPVRWQELCLRFMQTIAPLMELYNRLDDSPFYDDLYDDTI